MNWKSTLFLLLVTSGMLFGCATPTTQRAKVDDALVEIEARKQREIALLNLLSEQRRLDNVAYPLSQAAAPLCDEHSRPDIGLTFVNKYSFPEAFRDTAISQLGVGEALQVLHDISASPATRAGIKAGDILVALNGKSIATGEDAASEFARLLDAEVKAGRMMRITVVRQGEKLDIAALPAPACNYPVLLSDSNEVNAFADGKRIIITKGMMRFSESDHELALVIAHEMAHNTMHHMKARTQNYLLGSIFDILAAAYGVNTQGTFGNIAVQAYSQEFEAEADYVGLYIMARAGLPVEDAANFWRRMAVANPGSIGRTHTASHPATAERFVAIEQTIAEIRHKTAAGMALTPEYKESKQAIEHDSP